MRLTALFAASLLPLRARALSPNLWLNWTWVPGDGALPMSPDNEAPRRINGETTACVVYLHFNKDTSNASLTAEGDEHAIDDDNFVAHTFAEYGRHSFEISLPDSGRLERLDATIGIESEASSFDTVPKRVEPFVKDGGWNSFFQCDSASAAGDTAQVPLSADRESTLPTPGLVFGAGECRFAVPRNTTFLVLRAYARADGADDVGLRTWPPTPFPQRERHTVLRREGASNASPVVLDAVVLDPAVTYVMSVESRAGVAGVSPVMALQDVTFYSAVGYLSEQVLDDNRSQTRRQRRNEARRLAPRHKQHGGHNSTSFDAFLPTASPRPFGGNPDTGVSGWGGTPPSGAGRHVASPAVLALTLLAAAAAL